MLSPLLLALSLHATQTTPTGGDAAVIGSALAAQQQFNKMWESAWVLSERERRKTLYELSPEARARLISPNSGCSFTLFRCGPTGPVFIKPEGVNEPRVADRTCNFGADTIPMYVPEQAWGQHPNKRKIPSRENPRHWVCPNWLPPADFYLSGPRVPDERLGIDGALDPDYRRTIQRQRLAVTRQWSLVLQHVPTSKLAVGQLVRLYSDAGSANSALTTARSCAAEAWWCRALLGYVLHKQGRIVDADAAFAESMALAPPAERCRLANIDMLFGDAHRDYSATPCAARDSVHARAWWLADPLWSVPGNDRRTEQFARRIAIDLRAATGRDERYNWMAGGGGDALAEMVARYGWMSYASRGDSAASVRFPPPRPPMYGVQQLYAPTPDGPPLPDPIREARALGGALSTFEYSLGRVHTMPTWSMLTDPFGITTADWSLNAPGGEAATTMMWWPQEHYAPLHPLIAFTDQQTGFLRRDSTTLFAYATNLSETDLARRPGDDVRTVLMVSPGPADVVRLAERIARAIDRVTFLAPLPSTAPSIVSAEVPWDADGRRGARARFGIRPPPPLSAMRPGELAMSDPVLLVVPANAVELPLHADSAIALMRGSESLAVGTRTVGVYWETYGFNASDTVEVTVTVRRRAEGLLERIGAATRITGDPNTPVSVSWKEPERGRPTRVAGGAVPIHMRSVILNIAGLPAGTYALDVSVMKSETVGVTARRAFVVR